MLFDTLGYEPGRDEDGDLPVSVHDGIVYVREYTDENIVLLHTVVVTDAVETAEISYVLHLLDQSYPDLKFSMKASTIGASLRLYTDQPVPTHVKRVLNAFADLLTDGDDIAESVSGNYLWADIEDVDVENVDVQDEDEELPAPIMVLLQLDAEGTGTLSPEDVAVICDNDHDAILRYLRIVSEQEIAWNKSADEALAAGASDEAHACQYEAQSWHATHESLREALRLVTLGVVDATRRTMLFSN